MEQTVYGLCCYHWHGPCFLLLVATVMNVETIKHGLHALQFRTSLVYCAGIGCERRW
jgi:hypothetical protein